MTAVNTVPSAEGTSTSRKGDDLAEAISRRRTFAIIAHPDAGKTTLTEHLLLSAGAVRLAGEVTARGAQRRTRSDWMEIERKRGISITSSVMTFEYRGLTFNLLDTPGHSDFSEDTYRTLTAVDAAVMVLDAAKGIEEQTFKLFEVCRLRDIPIITFVNKIDRDALSPLEIFDDIAERLALDAAPVVWPIGDGVGFRGVVDIERKELELTDPELFGAAARSYDAFLASPEVRRHPDAGPALEQLDLALSALPSFDLETFRAGHLTPVFYGSALTDAGVKRLLDALADWAPPPRPQPAEPAPIEPQDSATTGFVFKVQANMDRNHRDRVAFMRLSSGRFSRGSRMRNMRTGKEIAISNPMFFFAQDRHLAEEAVAGDIIGIPNHGTLSVGDTLTDGAPVTVTGIPSFAPEIVRRVRLPDAMKAKQMAKALTDLAEEGVVQVFRPVIGSDWLVGVVGALQMDVLKSRLEEEYGVSVSFEDAGHQGARWPTAADPQRLQAFLAAHRLALAEDRYGTPVFLVRDPWSFRVIRDNWPDIVFNTTRERGQAV